MLVVTTSASQTGRHALRPSAIEAHGACTKERSHSPRSFPSFAFFSFFPPFFSFPFSFFYLVPTFLLSASTFFFLSSFSFFFFLYSRNRTRDNRRGNEYTNASSFLSRYTFGDITSFLRVQLFATSSFHGPLTFWICRFFRAWRIRANAIKRIGRFFFFFFHLFGKICVPYDLGGKITYFETSSEFLFIQKYSIVILTDGQKLK